MSNGSSPDLAMGTRRSAASVRQSVILMLLAGGLSLAAPAAAATQGAFGAVSRGSITISVSVAPRIIYSQSAVRSGSGEEPLLLELACLQLTSRTGSYQMSRVDAVTGENVQMVLAATESGVRQKRSACPHGEDARWRIALADPAAPLNRGSARPVEVLLAPL